MSLLLVFQHGLLYGIILSIFASVVVLGSLRWNPEIWLNDYPPAVRQKFGPIGPEARRQRLFVAVPFFIGLIAILALAVARLQALLEGLAFPSVFVAVFTLMMVFNLWDLVIIDWLFLIVLRPGFAVLPGTEGMADYQDYWFPFVGFLKGTIGILVASVVIAGIVAAFAGLGT